MFYFKKASDLVAILLVHVTHEHWDYTVFSLSEVITAY